MLMERATITSFSSDYVYEYEIRHFCTKLGAVCLRHQAKLVVVRLLNSKFLNKPVLKSPTTTSIARLR